MATAPRSGLLGAILDAIHGSDDAIAGGAVTRLRVGLDAGDTSILVETTIGFGEYVDGAGDSLVLLGGELIHAATKTGDTFATLTRGVDGTTIPDRHAAGAVVIDHAQNSSAIDLVRRGLLVNTAIGTDVDVIGRNLGLHRCPGLTDGQYREVIRRIAYLAKQPLSAIHEALLAVYLASDFSVYERMVSRPNTIFVRIRLPLATSLRGRFNLNSGEPHVAAGGLVTTDYPIGSNGVLGVFLDLPATRWGIRDGAFDYFAGGSFLGNVITLGTDPGPVPVIVDYNGFQAHYLPPNEFFVNETDYPPYFADDLLVARCLLDQVRAAGVGVDVGLMP
jgi:hypothetical protein